MERHDARLLGLGPPPVPPHSSHSPGPIRRAPSMRAQEMMNQGSSDEIRYWNDVVLGLTGLKNLGKCVCNRPLRFQSGHS
jgi:ubiquitin carboxyl-terminal hydrolase 8